MRSSVPSLPLRASQVLGGGLALAGLATALGGFFEESSVGVGFALAFYGLAVGTVPLWGPVIYDWLRARDLSDDRSLLAEGLADMLDMGIPLVEALEHYAAASRAHLGTAFAPLTRVLPWLVLRLRQGSTLAQALQESGAFPQHWWRLLGAAEATGNLPQTLRHLAALEQRVAGVAWASRVPSMVGLLVLTLLCGMAGFVAVFILPTFMQLFAGLGLPLPWASRLLAWTGRNYPFPLALLTLGALLLLARPVRPALGAALGRLPGAWGVVRLEQQAAAASTLASATRLDMPLPEALAVAASSVSHPLYRQALLAASRDPAPDLAACLARRPDLFDAPLRFLAGQGERFGELPEALDRASVYLGEEAARAGTRASALLRGGIVVVLGLLCGLFVLGVMLPYFQVAAEIQGGLLLP
ncbi:MAG TPA: type II secretion system F family protein [Candidatus Nitrosotenuis sp.]|nr:type II secretion system F family protein [Candidatus Nitrosotenuis sp.]